jgi:hypothetical protein
MILTDKIIVNNKTFIKTYSSGNKYIECDGIMYSEAFDLAEYNKIYVETDIPIKIEPVENGGEF